MSRSKPNSDSDANPRDSVEDELSRVSVDDLVEIHEIGWLWFQTHAQQRMQLVSFWFLAMSFLSTGVVLAFAQAVYVGALVISLSITATSIAFLFLDRRTRELISYGEALMEHLEREIFRQVPIPAIQMVLGMHTHNRNQVSYRTIFSALYIGTAIVGLLSCIPAIIEIAQV